jgi:formylglycine-generating enzyme required for sulfatase activity
MKIYYATWLRDRAVGIVLNNMKRKNRLLSYFFLEQFNVTNKMFQKFIKTGEFDPTKDKDHLL